MQTSVIKKTLPLALLLVTGSAWAEWLKVGSSTEDNFYFDSSIIRVEGDKRKVWELVDYKQRDKYGAFSARMRNEYDCKLEKVQILSATLHSEPMAAGKTLSNEQYTTRLVGRAASYLCTDCFENSLRQVTLAKIIRVIQVKGGAGGKTVQNPVPESVKSL